MQWLRFERLIWDDGEPEPARYLCEACDAPIGEQHKAAMLSDANGMEMVRTIHAERRMERCDPRITRRSTRSVAARYAPEPRLRGVPALPLAASERVA